MVKRVEAVIIVAFVLLVIWAIERLAVWPAFVWLVHRAMATP